MATTDPMALANALDPSLYRQQLEAQQQQALATLLMQQGLAPQGNSEVIGGVAIRRSPMEGIAKLGALLSGQSMQGQANDKAAAMMANQSAAMRSAFGMDAPQGSQGMPAGVPGQGPALGAALAGGPPPAGGSSPAGMMGLPGMSPGQAMGSYFMSPDKYMDSYLKGYTPNETTISARQGGVDPQMANRLMLIKNSTDPKILGMQQAGMSPEMIYASIYGAAAKDAEVDRKAGNQFGNFLTGESGTVPKIPENANPVGAPARNGAISGVVPIPGAPGVVSTNSASQTAGTNSQTPTIRYDGQGRPIGSTKANDVQLANQVPAGVQASRDAESLKIIDMEIKQASDPTEKAALERVRGRLIASTPSLASTPEQPPGVVESAKNSQDTMNTSYKTVMQANAPAQTIQARFAAISSLKDAAITGGDTEWRDKANNLLQLAGISERAVDRKTAGDLIDKNAAQISLAIGSGTTGTDSLRALASAANPSRHMTPQAIQEAVDQLSASAKVQQAKAKALTPIYNSGDSKAYHAAEQKFDAASDYRLWQLQSMTPDQAKALLFKMSPAEQSALRAKAAELKTMGVL